MANLAGLHVHLNGQQEREQRLVLLVQPAGAVAPELVGEVADDVLDALRGVVALLGSERGVGGLMSTVMWRMM